MTKNNLPSQNRRSFLSHSVKGGLGLAALSLPSLAFAAKDQITWRVVLQHRNGAQYKKWLWLEEELPKRTHNRLKLELTTIPELGLQGTEILRVIKTGMVDVAEVLTGYVASDFPTMEATDLPGLITSYSQARTVYDAWVQSVVNNNEALMGGKTLATFSYGTMPVFTKFPLNSLEDFQNKKIRVFSPAQARYITALGGEPISMPIADVYSALQRGIMDGLITGLEWVSGMKMWEIAGHVSDINIAPLGCYIVVGQRAWDRLPEDLKTVVLDLSEELTDLGWQLGQDDMDSGLRLAAEHNMTITIPGKENWQPRLKQICEEDILPWWAKRAGKKGVESFNETLTPILNISA